MIHGYHVIFGAYGFWLPNDPRGSWSDLVRSWELFRFGPATKIKVRHSVARVPHDRDRRQKAKDSLAYPPVSFDGIQARAIGTAFGEVVQRTKITIWACSILPEHVHLVVARHRYVVEQIVNLLKGSATKALRRQAIHPLEAWKSPEGRVPKCFARGEWKAYLDSDEDIRRASVTSSTTR